MRHSGVVAGLTVLAVPAVVAAFGWSVGAGMSGGAGSATKVNPNAALAYDGQNVILSLSSAPGFSHAIRMDAEYVEGTGGGSAQARAIFSADSTSYDDTHSVTVDTEWAGYEGDVLRVWVRVFAEAGEYLVFSEDIALKATTEVPDVLAPTITDMAVDAPDSSGGYLVYGVDAYADETVAAAETRYKINEGDWSDATPWSFGDSYVSFPTVTTDKEIATVVDDDALTVGLRVRDAAENWSDWSEVTVDVDRYVDAPAGDTTPPTVDVASAAWDSLGGDNKVRLFFTSEADEDAVHRAAYSTDGGTRVLLATADTLVAADSLMSWTVELTDTPINSREYRMFAWAEDAAENEGGPDSSSVTITREDEPEQGDQILWVATNGGSYSIDGSTLTVNGDEFTHTDIRTLDGSGTFAYCTISVATGETDDDQSTTMSIYPRGNDGMPLSGAERICLLGWSSLADSLASVSVDSAKIVCRIGQYGGTWDTADTLYVCAFGDATMLDEWDQSAAGEACYDYSDVSETTAWSAAWSTIDWFGDLGDYTRWVGTPGTASIETIDITDSMEDCESSFSGVAFFGYWGGSDRAYVTHHARDTASYRPVLLVWGRPLE